MNKAIINKIYADYTENTIRVYQAYSDTIADEALDKGTFGSSFKLERMTWIKPSFLWMMYRSGWATKPGQTRILAIDMKREGFDDIISKAVLSSFSKNIYDTYEDWQNELNDSDVRCQWDPERDIYGAPLERRSIQLGIKGTAIRQYVYEWIVKITDITAEVHRIRNSIEEKSFDEADLPIETEYTY